MTCNWTDLVGCFDPTCGDTPDVKFTYPACLTNDPADNFNDVLFADIDLSVPLTATTATVTSIAVYQASDYIDGGSFSCNCPFTCWGSCIGPTDSRWPSPCSVSDMAHPCDFGADPTAPPLGAQIGDYTGLDIVFDPTAPAPFDDIYAAAPIVDGATYTRQNTILVANITTDVGTTLYIIADTCCL